MTNVEWYELRSLYTQASTLADFNVFVDRQKSILNIKEDEDLYTFTSSEGLADQLNGVTTGNYKTKVKMLVPRDEYRNFDLKDVIVVVV